MSDIKDPPQNPSFLLINTIQGNDVLIASVPSAISDERSGSIEGTPHSKIFQINQMKFKT